MTQQHASPLPEPKLRIVVKRVLELTNDPRNARLHDEASIQSIMASMKRFEQQKPVVVNGEGVVVAGNGTLEAFRRLGHEFVEVVVTQLSEQDQRAYAIADNRTAEFSSWDYTELGAQLTELATDDYPVTDLGFTQDQIAELTAMEPETLDSPANAPRPVPLVPGAPPPDIAGSLQQSSIRVVQLFMSGEVHEQWEVTMRKLSAEYGTKTQSDTVVRAVYAAAGLPPPVLAGAPAVPTAPDPNAN